LVAFGSSHDVPALLIISNQGILIVCRESLIILTGDEDYNGSFLEQY